MFIEIPAGNEEESQALLVIPIVVVWLERSVDGSAAGAHLHGTLMRLAQLDVEIVSVITDRKTSQGGETYRRKILRLSWLMLSACCAARPGRVLLARYHPLMLPLLLSWRIAGGKVILSVQGVADSTSDNEYPWLRKSSTFRRLSVGTSKLAHALIAGAPAIEGYVRKEMLGRKAQLVSIANGVSTRDLGQASNSARPLDSSYAVFVGNLAKWQGIEVLVAAVKEPAWPEGLRLVIVGDGAERAVVEGQRDIIWLGGQPSAEANRWLSHAMCAFSLQRSDIPVAEHGYWPFKMIESAAAGVPVICSDAPGLPLAAELLGNAIVVPAQDPRSTAEAVRQLFADTALRARLAQEGRRNAEQFDWTAGARALETLIESVSARRR